VSLNTKDPIAAIKLADELRGKPPEGKNPRPGKTELEKAAKAFGEVPIRGGDSKSADYKQSLMQAAQNFIKVMQINAPRLITNEVLLDYYKKLRGTWDNPKTKKRDLTHARSESTARTYTTRVASIAFFAGVAVRAPQFPTDPPSRDVIIPLEDTERILKIAKGDLKFVLLCGLRAGMRRKEICMARPSWFILRGKPEIRIPEIDSATGFSPKSRRGRKIPLVTEFRDFILENYPDWHERKFCIAPNKVQGKWRYRYDTRAMLEKFAAIHCAELKHHTMRHSFTTHLADGGINVYQLSNWTGDRIETLEKHYIHTLIDAEKAEQAFAAHKPKAEKTPFWAQELMAAQGIHTIEDYLSAQTADLDRNDAVTTHVRRRLEIPEDWE
jgi:integrase